MVAPGGNEHTTDIPIPLTAQITAIIEEKNTTLLKLLNNLIADKAGKTTRADIKSEPTNFIPSTMTTAVSTASSPL
jgi:hypothetical protein